MYPPSDFEGLFRFEAWANREVLAVLRQSSGIPAKAASLLAHILAAQQLWFDRLTGVPQSMPVWPELTIAEMEALCDRLENAWSQYLGDHARLVAAPPVAYTNSKGESFQSRPFEIITHLFLHGAYHRGQIALVLRQAGITPPYTDYIHAVRTGAISLS